MKSMEVKARAPKIDREAVIYVNFGDTTKESVEMFGDEAVNSNAWAAARVTIQAGIRRLLEGGKSQEEVQTAFTDWKLGVAMERSSDPIAAALGKFKTMSEEEQAAFLEQLRTAAETA